MYSGAAKPDLDSEVWLTAYKANSLTHSPLLFRMFGQPDHCQTESNDHVLPFARKTMLALLKVSRSAGNGEDGIVGLLLDGSRTRCVRVDLSWNMWSVLIDDRLHAPCPRFRPDVEFVDE